MWSVDLVYGKQNKWLVNPRSTCEHNSSNSLIPKYQYLLLMYLYPHSSNFGQTCDFKFLKIFLKK